MTILRVLDYRNDGGTASGNLGDPVQTWAIVCLFARWWAVWKRVYGREESLEYITRPRDSGFTEEDVALDVIYGWHMHPQADGEFLFPPSFSNPCLITAFHVSRSTMLTQSAVDFLSAHAPVGCRDRPTMRALRERGVWAFLSFCGTQTLPPSSRQRRGELAIDVVPRLDGYTGTEMSVCEVRNRVMTPRQALLRSRCLMRLFASAASVVTSRLHVYLPSRSFGTRVSLESPHGDTRTDWGPPGRLECVKAYARGEANPREDVRVLERGVAAVTWALMHGRDILTEWTKAVTTTLVVVCDTTYLSPAVVSLSHALESFSDCAVRVIMVTRGDDPKPFEEAVAGLSACFPGQRIERRPARDRLRGLYNSHLHHVNETTNDRLLLPEILHDVDRVLYVDCDVCIRTTSDFVDLYHSVRLGKTGIAARPSRTNIMTTETWNPANSYDGQESFNAGVLFLDLALLRRRAFVDFAESVLRNSPGNDQTILNLWCNGAFVGLPRWTNVYLNTNEEIEYARGRIEKSAPVVLHFCGSRKPWSSTHPLKAEWSTLPSRNLVSPPSTLRRPTAPKRSL